jgi:hypothetical protein
MGFGRNSRSLVDISRIFILVEFSGILRLVESGRFLRCRIGISRNLRLVITKPCRKYYGGPINKLGI